MLTGCDRSFCSNETIDERISPDGKYTASYFERNCGATTPYIQVISLYPSNTEFDPENHKDWVFTIHGKSDVEMY
jgi:hypothetical protein